MELNEIKKALYKQNPQAEISDVRKDGIVYRASVDIPARINVKFIVPLNEIGETIFTTYMPAKLLIRYIV